MIGMKRFLKINILLVGIFVPIATYAKVISSSGKKPQWVTKGDLALDNQRSNNTYHFMSIMDVGTNLQELRQSRFHLLAESIGKENQISGENTVEMTNEEGEVVTSTIRFKGSYTNQYKTDVFYSRLVDEYWECVSFGEGGRQYKYYALFAVSENGQKPVFDEFSSTTSYGAGPVFMSIIPGLGQFYKGSTTKGVCMLAGVAACGVAALFCENERSDYKNKMKEQPQHAQTYNTKANNYETARNVCLGVGVAIWIYNIIDAAAAKGARKIVVKPASGTYLSLHPVASLNSMGVSLTYNF